VRWVWWAAGVGPVEDRVENTRGALQFLVNKICMVLCVCGMRVRVEGATKWHYWIPTYLKPSSMTYHLLKTYP